MTCLINASAHSRYRARWAKNLLIVLGVALYLAAVPGRSYGQVSCERVLVRANDYYYDARFDDAIVLLKQCLDQGAFSQEEHLQVYTLLSLACFANRQEADARQAIQVLLSLHPDYEPDPISAQPSYRALVEDVRGERSPVVEAESTSPTPALLLTNTTTPTRRRQGFSKWIYFGGGAILTSAVVLLLSSSSGGSNPPPGQGGPPPPPPGQ